MNEKISKGDQIRQWLCKADRNLTWLSRKLGLSLQNLSYKLDHPKALDADTFEEIKNIFEKAGTVTDETERCNSLIRNTIQIDASINHLLSILNQNVVDFTSDKQLNFKEKKVLSNTIDEMKRSFDSHIEKLESIIEG